MVERSRDIIYIRGRSVEEGRGKLGSEGTEGKIGVLSYRTFFFFFFFFTYPTEGKKHLDGKCDGEKRNWDEKDKQAEIGEERYRDSYSEPLGRKSTVRSTKMYPDACAQ